MTTLTLIDPATTAAFPTLVVKPIQPNGYVRGQITRMTLDGFTQSQRAIIRGGRGKVRFIWKVLAQMSESDLALLEAIAAAQDDRFTTFQDGHWVLEDRVRRVFPSKLSPHPKTLIAGTTATEHGATTGMGRFKVAIALPEDYATLNGYHLGSPSARVAFDLVELPGD